MPTSGPTGAGGFTVVAGTVWANQANAQGLHDSTVCTWTSTTSGASGTIDLTTYGAWAAIPAGSSVDAVSVDVYQRESATATRMASVTAQLFVGTTAKLPVQTLTRSTTVGNHDVFAVTGLPTLAELQGGTIKIRVIATRAAVTTACALDLDAAEITVTYTPPLVAGLAWAVRQRARPRQAERAARVVYR